MELLRKQIETLQTSFKEKESRMKLDQDRLKRRVEELTKRNAELQEEVKVLEQERAAYVERNMQTSVGSYKKLTDKLTDMTYTHKSAIANRSTPTGTRKETANDRKAYKRPRTRPPNNE